jgi:hypothetical protein
MVSETNIVHIEQDVAYPSSLQKMLQVWNCQAPTSPQEILSKHKIDTVIFSHTHLSVSFEEQFSGMHTLTQTVYSDHVGDASNLPAETTLLFGRYQDTSKVTDKQKLAQSLFLQEEALMNRKIEHLSNAQWQTYGSFSGIDYFEDGSLLLLDTPGVSIANYNCELKRLTASYSIGRVI